MAVDHFNEIHFAGGPPADPHYSVCLPTYNRGDRIGAAIESARAALGDRSYEIVVADNASTDQTAEVVAGFNDGRLRLLQYQDLASMYANHNRSIAEARGCWIAILHSDDVFPDQYFAAIDRQIESTPDADLLTDLSLADIGIPIEQFVNQVDPVRRAALVAASAMSTGAGPPSGSVYRRAAFDRGGWFDERQMLADTTLVITWALAGLRLSHFRHDPPVWTIKDCSMSVDPNYRVTQWKFFHHVFDAAFQTEHADAVEAAMMEIWPMLPVATRVQMLYLCHATGYASLAWRLWRHGGGAWRCAIQPRFYTHVIPTRIDARRFHEIKGQIATTARRLKMRFRTAAGTESCHIGEATG